MDNITDQFTEILSSPSMMPIIGLVVIIFAMNMLLKKKKSTTKEDSKNITYPYIKADLLTLHELNFYTALKVITDKYQLHIIPKVRVADLINVKKDVTGSERQAAFNRIKSKHVDFVLANHNNLEVMCLIELDDSSHDKAAAAKNDTFKNTAFQTVGLPLLRVKNAAGLEEQICKTLLIKQK